MKRTDLLKKLAEVGQVEIVREGENHTLCRVNGRPITIPLHREINELTVKGIVQDAMRKG